MDVLDTGEAQLPEQLWIRPLVYSGGETEFAKSQLVVCTRRNGPLLTDEEAVSFYPFTTPGKDIKADFFDHTVGWGEALTPQESPDDQHNHHDQPEAQ